MLSDIALYTLSDTVQTEKQSEGRLYNFVTDVLLSMLVVCIGVCIYDI